MKNVRITAMAVIMVSLFIVSSPKLNLADENQKAERPEWSVGDHWNYQIVYMENSRIPKCEVDSCKLENPKIFKSYRAKVEVIKVRDNAPKYIVKKGDTLQYFTENLELQSVKTFPNEGFVEDWEPSQKHYLWPLEVGKTWKEKLWFYSAAARSRG